MFFAYFRTFEEDAYPAAQIYYRRYVDVVLMVCFCVLVEFKVEPVLSIFEILQLFVILIFGNPPEAVAAGMLIYFRFLL